MAYEKNRALSRRNRAAGDVEKADYYQRRSHWHGHAVDAIKSHGNQLAKNVSIAGGEAVSTDSLKDTLTDPDLVAIESSQMRGELLLSNEVVALGIDVANTIGASNTVEKLLAHEIALAHKLANEQAAKASCEEDPLLEIKRLRLATLMMNTFQHGVLTLHRLRTGGTQNVVVQHVHVSNGGQAVIGAVQTGGCKHEEK